LSFSAHVITLFPELFPGPLGASVIGRGMADGLWSLATTQLREFATDRHRTVDDTPSGGGAGMVLKPDILARAIDAVSPADDPRPRILMSPRGLPLTQARVRELAGGPGAIIVCGRFEGVDQRVIEARGLEEISIGDYVLAGGEVAQLRGGERPQPVGHAAADYRGTERARKQLGKQRDDVSGKAQSGSSSPGSASTGGSMMR
jgi:tRNA (guanine37-N1)-methyltransferase